MSGKILCEKPYCTILKIETMKPLITSIAIEDQKIILSEKMELNVGSEIDPVTYSIEVMETYYLCLHSSRICMALPSSPILRPSFKFLKEHFVI